jgi:hypothetical protein
MSGITQTLTYSFLFQLTQGMHNFSPTVGNIFKLALFKKTALITGTYDANTTDYSEMVADEVVAAGYTAGGIALTNVATSSDGVALLSFANPTFTAALTSRGGLIYNSNILGPTKPSVAIIDFGADKTSNATLTVQMPALSSTTALIRLQPQAQ